MIGAIIIAITAIMLTVCLAAYGMWGAAGAATAIGGALCLAAIVLAASLEYLE